MHGHFGIDRHELCREPCEGIVWLTDAENDGSEHSLSFFSICSTFYEDWAFVMDEERSSMLPTMAAGKLGQGQGCGAGGPVKPGEQRRCLGVNV